MSNSCKNSQSSPFLHRPRSQCLQTTARSPLICRKGHKLPLLHVDVRKNVHIAEPDSTNKQAKMQNSACYSLSPKKDMPGKADGVNMLNIKIILLHWYNDEHWIQTENAWENSWMVWRKIRSFDLSQIHSKVWNGLRNKINWVTG